MSPRKTLSADQIIVLIALGWALVVGAEALVLYRLTPPRPAPTPVAPVTVENSSTTAPVQAPPVETAPTPLTFSVPNSGNAPGMAPTGSNLPAPNSGQPPRIAANPGAGGALPVLPPPPSFAPNNANRNAAPGADNGARAAFEAGQAALRANDKEAARAEFERAVQIAPDNLPSQLNLASVYLDLKQPARAVPHLQIVAARDPKNAAVQFTLARALLADRKLEAALPVLQKTVQLAPAEKEARVLLAQVLFDLKKPRESYAQWTTLAQREPKDAGLQLQAASLASDVLKEPREAETWLRRALIAQPKNPQAALALGRLLLARRDAKGAATILTGAARATPDEFAIYPMLADARTASGDIAGAASALRSALQKLPAAKIDAQRAPLKATQGALRLALGRALGASKQPKAARVEFEKAADLLPRDAEPRALAGVAALQLKDSAGAINNFKRALQIDPKRAGDRKTLAQLLADTKQWKQADAQFALYDGLKPNDAPALLQWSQVAGQIKNPARQAQVLAKAARAAPKNAEVWTALALAQRAKGDKRAALASFQKLAKLKPGDADVLYETARLQSELGDAAGAYHNYKNVVEARPKAPEAYPALLEAADKAGQSPNARQFLVRELAQNENGAALRVILDFYSRKNRSAEARAFLTDLVARAPKQDGPRTALSALEGASQTPAATATAAPVTEPATP